jgi:hypothetical protein
MDLFSLALIVSVFSATCIGAVISGESTTGTAAYCQIGTYRFSNGEIVDIARSEGDTFRWRKFDGTTGVLHKKEDGSWTSTLGWTDRPDGHTASFARCANGEIQFDGKKAHRIAFDATDTLFEGRSGAKLAGRLVLPKGNEQIPIVVLVHGAERDSARESTVYAHPQLQFRILLKCAAYFQRAFGWRFGIIIENERDAVACGDCEQAPRGFRGLEFIRASDNLV